MLIPSLLLKKLYTLGSLKNTPGGVEFAIKNRLSDAELVGLVRIAVDGRDSAAERAAPDDGGRPLPDPGPDHARSNRWASRCARWSCARRHSGAGRWQTCTGHHLRVAAVRQAPVLGGGCRSRRRARSACVSRAPADDYAPEIIAARQGFVEQTYRRKLQHIPRDSSTRTWRRATAKTSSGSPRCPLGLAGPLRVNGEHAQGDFLIPLATAEGTLVASYNRGMKVLNLCGGVKCTVVDDAMQRAPVFVFEDARGAREFVKWVVENIYPSCERKPRPRQRSPS